MGLVADLRKIKKLLYHWTKGACARTKDGEPVSPLSEEAYYFCLSGAIQRVNPSLAKLFFNYLKFRGSEHESLVEWNDAHSKSGVLGLVDAVISCVKDKKHETNTFERC